MDYNSQSPLALLWERVRDSGSCRPSALYNAGLRASVLTRRWVKYGPPHGACLPFLLAQLAARNAGCRSPATSVGLPLTHPARNHGLVPGQPASRTPEPFLPPAHGWEKSFETFCFLFGCLNIGLVLVPKLYLILPHFFLSIIIRVSFRKVSLQPLVLQLAWFETRCR